MQTNASFLPLLAVAAVPPRARHNLKHALPPPYTSPEDPELSKQKEPEAPKPEALKPEALKPEAPKQALPKEKPPGMYEISNLGTMLCCLFV